MKELILALAEYNRMVNLRLLEILETADQNILTNETGTFYGTVFGTIRHCFGSEFSWLKRMRSLRDYPSLKVSILREEADSMKAKADENFPTLASYIKEIDTLFVSFAREVSEEELRKTIKFKNSRGEEQERFAWQMIFHVFNHMTHHRGEISATLDRMGVKNDYSGFLGYL